MPQNLLEPTWMELDSDDHFDCPERGRRTQHEVPGATRRFEDFIDTYAPDVGTGPRLPAELLCLWVRARWRGLLPPAVNSPGAYLSERLLPRCLEWRIPIARSLGVFGLTDWR
jgi:hypothetical protein